MFTHPSRIADQQSRRSPLRALVSGTATAALVGSTLVFAPQASAVTYTCNDDSATLSNDDSYCQRVFDSPGTTSWTVPAQATSLDILLVAGGGGGGGGGKFVSGVGGGNGGDSGAPGSATEVLAEDGLAGSNLDVTVGAGGTTGKGGQDDPSATGGGDGGRSEVAVSGGASLATAAGGSGGEQAKFTFNDVNKTPVVDSVDIDQLAGITTTWLVNGHSIKAGGRQAGAQAAQTFPLAGQPGPVYGGGGGGGQGGSGTNPNPPDVPGGLPGADGGEGAKGIVIFRYASISVLPTDNGGGSDGGGGGAPAPSGPAVAVPAPPSPVSFAQRPGPTQARAKVGGGESAIDIVPLVDQVPQGEQADRIAALPESARAQLPGSNGVQVSAGSVEASLVGPQASWPRSPDLLIMAPNVPLAVQTSGFSAGSSVEVFVQNVSGTWVLVDTLTVGPDGTLDASLTIPDNAPVGPGSLQLQGTDTSGETVALAVGAQIAPPVAPVPTSAGPLPQVTPGEASATDAEGNPLVFAIDRVDGTDVEIRVGESLTSIQALDGDGTQPLASDGAIEIEEEGFVRVGGEGFQPNSMVQVWAFSEATFVGLVLTDENGAYTSLLELPEELELGDHTLQNSGTAFDGQPLAVSAGLRIIAPGSDVTEQPQAQETARASTTVYFGRGSSTLDAADRKELDRLVRKVGDSTQRVRITGYVQASSTTSNDQSLSRARARSVAKYLRSQGVDAKYTIRGRGVLDAPSDEARSARVTVVYTK